MEAYRHLCAAIIEQAVADLRAGPGNEWAHGEKKRALDYESARAFLFSGGLEQLALAAGLDVNLKAIKERLKTEP